MEEKKKGKGLVVALVLFILVSIGLGGYIVYDKVLTKEEVKTKTEEKKENKKEETVSIDIDDESIISLFKNSHASVIGPDSKIFQNDELKVENMDEDYKWNLASNIYYDKSVNVGNKLELKESDVKNAYESIFGPKTYNRPNEIKTICEVFKYNEISKKYEAQTGGCGGATAFGEYEKIVKATKYNDRIEITSAVIFTDGQTNAMYKDYDKKEKIKDLTEEDLVNTVDNPSEKRFKDYVIENKDKLDNYVYTYKLNEDGFYYYTGVKRIKNK